MKSRIWFLITLLYLVACQQATVEESINYPKSIKLDITENYFGTIVPAPYRWLENENSDSVKTWVHDQNRVTFDYLEKIPYRKQIQERLTDIWNYPKYSAPFKEGGHYFFFKNDGLQNQSVLYIQENIDAEPQVFLDPNKLSTDGTVALGTFAASHDGKYLAYAIAKGGSDWNEFFVMNIASKQKLDDHLKWIKFSGIAWYKNGFYYTRYEEPDKELSSQNENSKIYYHTIGTKQSEDKLIFEDKTHPKYIYAASTTEDERYLLLYGSQGASSKNTLYFKDLSNFPHGDFKPIVDNYDNKYSVIDNFEEKLLILTNKDASKYKLVLVDPFNPAEENWREIVPEKDEAIQNVATAGNKVFVTYMKDVSSKIAVYDPAGNFENNIELPTLGNAGGFWGDKEDTFVFYTFNSFVYPTVTYKYNIQSKTSEIYRKSKIDFAFQEYETKQVFYKSKDGTRIPMFITHKKGLKLNGDNPTLLYGYGGFNISITPSFSIANVVFLENGGVYAVATLRGGSEYGEEWHQAGVGLNKQNVFDDFIAAAEYLIDQKYTSSEKLAISGRSNGGLLVGACMTQRPELFKVALPGVGVMDMLRFHKFTIGYAWITEYGSSEDSIEFQNLYAYSPMHNIRENVCYPATLVTTADHDDRVVPAHSYKFMAALQEKQACNNPVLIRIETKAGHGAGKPTAKRIEEITDTWSFVFYNLGVIPIY